MFAGNFSAKLFNGYRRIFSVLLERGRDVRLTKPRILRCLAIGSFALLKLAKPKGVTLDQLWVDFGGNIVELIRIANEIVKFAFTGLVLNKQTIARSHRLVSCQRRFLRCLEQALFKPRHERLGPGLMLN